MRSRGTGNRTITHSDRTAVIPLNFQKQRLTAQARFRTGVASVAKTQVPITNDRSKMLIEPREEIDRRMAVIVTAVDVDVAFLRLLNALS